MLRWLVYVDFVFDVRVFLQLRHVLDVDLQLRPRVLLHVVPAARLALLTALRACAQRQAERLCSLVCLRDAAERQTDAALTRVVLRVPVDLRRLELDKARALLSDRRLSVSSVDARVTRSSARLVLPVSGHRSLVQNFVLYRLGFGQVQTDASGCVADGASRARYFLRLFDDLVERRVVVVVVVLARQLADVERDAFDARRLVAVHAQTRLVVSVTRLRLGLRCNVEQRYGRLLTGRCSSYTTVRRVHNVHYRCLRLTAALRQQRGVDRQRCQLRVCGRCRAT